MKTSGKLLGLGTILIIFSTSVQMVFAQEDNPALLFSTAPPETEAGAGGNDTAATGGESPKSGNTVADTEFRGPAAWLRICEPGAEKYVGVVTTSKEECPAGYWFKDALKVGCACGHGVWVFAKGWCDHSAQIIVAHNGSCFNVNKEVKFIRHIGWSHNAFMPFHFVGTTGLEYIQDVPDISSLSSFATYYNYEYNQHMGAINRERAIESMTGRVCLSPEGNTSRPLSMKYFVPKLPYMQKKNCFGYAFQDGQRFEYEAGYDLMEGLTLVDAPTFPFRKPQSWATSAEAEKCSKECPAPRGLSLREPRNNSIGPDYIDPILDEYFLAELKDLGWNDTSALPSELPERNLSRIYTLTEKTTTEIQEQTKRILQINLMSAIAKTPAPGVKFPDYKLLQKARAIFDQVCPEEELPSPVLTGMLRMFRVVVNESLFHYPYDEVGDEEETGKIFKLLDTCSKEAKIMKFVYSNDNNNQNGSNRNGTGNGTEADGADSTLPKCGNGIGNGKFIGVDYEFNSTLNRTILSRIPRHLSSNITDLDLVVETAWKTVMFAHYYCARHFKEDSIDYSLFEQKMEKFFNRWIQHRWFYPGTSLKGNSYLFQAYSLERFALAMDRCVAAARSFSVYRKWIQRPVYLKFVGGKLFEEQYEIPDKIAGRTTLDAINPNPNQFNNKAYCLPFWHAPVSNPGLNYNPEHDYKPGCVKYRKAEWENPFMQSSRSGGGWKNSLNFL